jgi:hypothetical protein
MRKRGLQVLEVRDRALIELLDPALLDQQRRIPRVVGHDDDVAVDRLPTRKRALDLAEVGRVVVDVFCVLHGRAGLLLEHVERRMTLRLLVDIDVERPVREAKRLRKRVIGA